MAAPTFIITAAQILSEYLQYCRESNASISSPMVTAQFLRNLKFGQVNEVDESLLENISTILKSRCCPAMPMDFCKPWIAFHYLCSIMIQERLWFKYRFHKISASLSQQCPHLFPPVLNVSPFQSRPSMKPIGHLDPASQYHLILQKYTIITQKLKKLHLLRSSRKKLQSSLQELLPIVVSEEDNNNTTTTSKTKLIQNLFDGVLFINQIGTHQPSQFSNQSPCKDILLAEYHALQGTLQQELTEDIQAEEFFYRWVISPAGNTNSSASVGQVNDKLVQERPALCQELQDLLAQCEPRLLEQLLANHNNSSNHHSISLPDLAGVWREKEEALFTQIDVENAATAALQQPIVDRAVATLLAAGLGATAGNGLAAGSCWLEQMIPGILFQFQEDVSHVMLMQKQEKDAVIAQQPAIMQQQQQQRQEEYIKTLIEMVQATSPYKPIRFL